MPDTLRNCAKARAPDSHVSMRHACRITPAAIEPESGWRLHVFYNHTLELSAAFTPLFLAFMLERSVTGGIAMDLLYLIAIAAFGGLVVAFAIGCDKLHRAPGGRP
ncbi:hypothetical protein WQE_38464 [Paraburkholderia hospita]|uniref:MFS transporter n=1 Tax=Paraburkholderia hospita TaxID=169430 RepID=A0ABP2PCU3_9BURK|nr:hypothetical protein WQE_38464 [Paraburkholderia hospita]